MFKNIKAKLSKSNAMSKDETIQMLHARVAELDAELNAAYEIGEPEDFMKIHHCNCGKIWHPSDLSEEANGNKKTVKFWLENNLCPKCYPV